MLATCWLLVIKWSMHDSVIWRPRSMTPPCGEGKGKDNGNGKGSSDNKRNSKGNCRGEGKSNSIQAAAAEQLICDVDKKTTNYDWEKGSAP
jgi:hypothetical protein